MRYADLPPLPRDAFRAAAATGRWEHEPVGRAPSLRKQGFYTLVMKRHGGGFFCFFGLQPVGVFKLFVWIDKEEKTPAGVFSGFYVPTPEIASQLQRAHKRTGDCFATPAALL